MAVEDWFPAGMDPADVTALLEAYPGDPHAAAADAWEDYAASLAPEAEATSVSTGAQSVTYSGRSSAAGVALDRADWHRRRANVKSVKVGPEQEFSDTFYGNEDVGTIQTVWSPPIGG